MVSAPVGSDGLKSIEWLAAYHSDVLRALKLLFLPGSTCFQANPLPSSPMAREERLSSYVQETDVRSSLAILTSVEAAFKLDYEIRCRKRMKDPLSRNFRLLFKRDQSRVSLDRDIFEAWAKHATESAQAQLIGELRAGFKFRNWLAHGRYWKPRLGKIYTFENLYRLIDAVYDRFPLCGLDEF